MLRHKLLLWKSTRSRQSRKLRIWYSPLPRWGWTPCLLIWKMRTVPSGILPAQWFPLMCWEVFPMLFMKQVCSFMAYMTFLLLQGMAACSICVLSMQKLSIRVQSRLQSLHPNQSWMVSCWKDILIRKQKTATMNSPVLERMSAWILI